MNHHNVELLIADFDETIVNDYHQNRWCGCFHRESFIKIR